MFIIGIIPFCHWLIQHGWTSWVESSLRASFTCLCLMGILYIAGALLYAMRIPERFFPGKCDIWVREITCSERFNIFSFLQFHSHQLFHILVIAAAMVHYRGISEMASYRLNYAPVCEAPVSAPADHSTTFHLLF